jgi:hypothetical protein
MTNSVQTLAGRTASYFLSALFSLLLAIVIGCLLTGCENSTANQQSGQIVGVAHLSDPDPGTGDAGILVYLAGTQYQVRTDQQGRYRITGVQPGTYDLIAEKNGYQGQVIEGILVGPTINESTPPAQPADVLLIKQSSPSASPTTGTLGSVTGRVYLEGLPDENGGVRIELDGTAFVTVSSNDGQYRLLNVEPGQYKLSFYKDGYLPYRMPDEITVTTATATTIPDVALELMQAGDPVSAGAVAEQVATRAMAPAPNEPPPGPTESRSIVGIVEVKDAAGRLMSDYSNVTIAINGTSHIAEINDQGQFRFDNLTSGVYTLIGTIPEGPLVQIPVDLENQRTASISVRLVTGGEGGEAGGTVRGKVVLVDLDDKPLPDSSGVRVAVNGTQSMATTAADGSFSLTAIPPGTYTISATKEGFVAGEAANAEVNAAAAVDVGEIRMMMDVERPRVLSTVPADNTRDVQVGFDLPITVKFSDKMNPATLQDAVTISPNTPATISIGKGSAPGADDDTMIITLSNADPQAPIQFGATYRITIPGEAANFAGVTMGKPHVFSFSTSKPGIMATTPANNATGVYVDQTQSPVIISFNTRLDPDSVSDRTVRVRPDNGKSVSVTYNNNDQSGWTTVRVATQWEPDTNYTVTVTRRVRAYNGQPLGNTPYTLKFRTQRMEIMSVPIQTVR